MKDCSATRCPPANGADDLENVVGAALGAYGVPLKRSGQWRLALPKRKGTARIDNHWLVLELRLRRRRKLAPFALLERNAELRGNAKHVMLGDASIRLRVDVPVRGVPIRGPLGIATPIREAVAALAHAGSVGVGEDRGGGRGGGGGALLPLAPTVCEPSGLASSVAVERADLTRLCGESGWPYEQRSGESVSVDLEVSGRAFYQAIVSHQPSDRIRLRVDLVRGGEVAGAEQHKLAVAVLLLSVNGVVRMARGVIRQMDQRFSAGFEASLSRRPSLAEFVHALSALSIACDMCGREVEALMEDAELARSFLEIRRLDRLVSGHMPPTPISRHRAGLTGERTTQATAT